MAVKSSRSGMPQHPDIAALASAVRTARRRHGMTQAALAGLSGTGLRFISELERGKPSLALNKVVDVLSTLGLRLRVLDPSDA